MFNSDLKEGMRIERKTHSNIGNIDGLQESELGAEASKSKIMCFNCAKEIAIGAD